MGQMANIDSQILIALALAAIAIYLLMDSLQRRSRRGKPYLKPVTDPAEQLRNVMAADFSARKVMSSAEYRVFQAVEAEIRSARDGHRVFAQTSLGEILQSSSALGFSAINSKRADILVVGPTGLPRLAVEYQGEGHFQGAAAARDAGKKEALRKAGVAYVEIYPTHSADQIRSLVRLALSSALAPSGQPDKSNTTGLTLVRLR